MSIGNKLAEARKKQNLTQEQLADEGKKKERELLLRLYSVKNIKVK